jgi:hypothetical protein
MAMRRRCTDPLNIGYPDYGGRGITVCPRWDRSFEAFFEDMGFRPPGTTLDRYPNPWGNYGPGNTRWATPKQQRHNRRDNTAPPEPPPSEREQEILRIWPGSKPWPPGSEGERWFEDLMYQRFRRNIGRHHHRFTEARAA